MRSAWILRSLRGSTAPPSKESGDCRLRILRWVDSWRDSPRPRDWFPVAATANGRRRGGLRSLRVLQPEVWSHVPGLTPRCLQGPFCCASSWGGAGVGGGENISASFSFRLLVAFLEWFTAPQSPRQASSNLSWLPLLVIFSSVCACVCMCACACEKK